MAGSRFKLYGGFEKIEKRDDGTLYVEGFASSGLPDSDGETVLPSAMKAALPEYLKFGAVREMHGPVAAGTAVFAEVQKDGRTRFATEVVDAGSVKKVEKKVLKGFSIGGRVLKRNADDQSVIEEISLTEISLVDRPANPAAVIDLVKFDAGGKPVPVAKAARHDHALLKSLVVRWRKAADAGTVPLKKGLYSIADFAACLSSLECLLNSRTYEEDYENDDAGKALNVRLAASIDSLGQLLLEMTSEELSELHPGYREGDDTMAANAGKTDDAKKTDTPAAPANPLGDAVVEALLKAVAANPELLAKYGITVKPATPEERIAKLEAQNGELIENVAALTELLTKALGGKQPARKGVTMAVSVSKEKDAASLARLGKAAGADPEGDPDVDPATGDKLLDHVMKSMRSRTFAVNADGSMNQ